MGDEKSEPTVGVVKQIDSDLSSVQLKIVSLKTLRERPDPRRGGLMSYRKKIYAKTDRDRGDRRRISTTAALLRKDQVIKDPAVHEAVEAPQRDKRRRIAGCEPARSHGTPGITMIQAITYVRTTRPTRRRRAFGAIGGLPRRFRVRRLLLSL